MPKFEGKMTVEVCVTIGAINLDHAENIFRNISVSSPVAISVGGHVDLLALEDNANHGHEWEVKEIEENG
jgi:hypothetical protein